MSGEAEEKKVDKSASHGPQPPYRGSGGGNGKIYTIELGSKRVRENTKGRVKSNG